MRVIKPGKLGAPTPDRTARPKSDPALKPREIWDDFGARKKTKKKVEYEKGGGDRMVPRTQHRSLFGPPPQEVLDAQALQTEDRSRYRNDFEVLEEKFGYTFSNRDLLLRALTHRSALGGKERTDYERLEFLGDAVLDLTIAHLLSDRYLEAKEGELSKMRAALVNTQALANIAKELEIGTFIRLGRGEASSGGQERASILADVMEAIVGAMYQDCGYEKAFTVIHRIFGQALEQVEPSDPKTELQELLHAAGSEPPSYLLELVEGPEHSPTFVTVVMVDGEIAGRGRGATKKNAQQAAAAEALAKLTPRPIPVKFSDGQRFVLTDLLLTAPIFQSDEENGSNGSAADEVHASTPASDDSETKNDVELSGGSNE